MAMLQAKDLEPLHTVLTHSSCTDDEDSQKAAAVRKAQQAEIHSKWSAQPNGCLFSQLAREASLALSSSPNPGILTGRPHASIITIYFKLSSINLKINLQLSSSVNEMQS